MPRRGKVQKHINAFNAGEWSPRVDARTNLQKYDLACRMLRNYILWPQGGADRRYGFEYIEETKDSGEARLFDFSFSTTTNYILEAGNQYMRFYSNGARVDNPSPVEVATPWPVSALFQVQYRQVNDVTYFVHPDYPCQKLTRTAADAFTMEAVDWTHPPFLDENLTSTSVQVNVTTGSGVMTSSAALFDTDHVGGYWQIGQVRPSESAQLSLNTDHSSSTVNVLAGQEWNLVTGGRWDGTVFLEAQNPADSSWEIIREYTSVNASLNIDTTGTQDVDTALRIRYDFNAAPTAGSEPAQANLIAPSVLNQGVVFITGFNNDQSVNVDVKKTLQAAGSPTVRWSEGLFSDFRGHARTIEIHEERLTFGGTEFKPRRMALSQSFDYENFERTADDDSALIFDVQGFQSNQINWLASDVQLMMGTSAGEFAIGSRDPDKPLTPSFTPAKPQTTYGGKHIQAVLTNDSVLFIQRVGKKIRELSYSFERDKNIAPELTRLAEHITGSGIKQTAYQQQPDQVVWMVTEDGELVGMTYERDQDVVGFHRHTTQGRFESVAVIYGEERDEIWAVVARDLPGGTKRYVERIRPFAWTKPEEFFFVDSGKSYPDTPLISAGPLVAGTRYRVFTDPTGTTDLSNVGGSADAERGDEFECTASVAPNDYGGAQLREVVNTFTGLDHLEGMTVQALVDGAPIDEQVVTGGSITIPDDEYGYVAHVGLGYSSRLQPMRVDNSAEGGDHQATISQIRELVIRFKDTVGILAGETEEELKASPFRATDSNTDELPPMLTGDFDLDFEGSFDFNGDLIIGQDDPLPSTILAITAKYEITGN